MNAARQPPTDDELDQLLASRFRDATPDFERRWVDLQRDLRRDDATARRRRWTWMAGWGGALVGLGGLALVALLLTRPTAGPAVDGAPEFSPAFVELLELNEVLDQALPLIDAENRDALLHLPVDAASPS